jgi:hypothetical protein
MPIVDHALFVRPDNDAWLWRYTDLPKFINLITTGRLWLSNLEILAKDDPYEGQLGSVSFPHRLMNSIRDMPEENHGSLFSQYKLDGGTEETIKAAFEHWYKFQETMCIGHQAERRNYFINCWHEAKCESVAMWKIYESPGAGVAIVSSCSRLEGALSVNAENLHLGRVNYRDPSIVEVDVSNYFEHLLSKLSSYSYEKEVRLAYWNSDGAHQPLANATWNPTIRQHENVIDDVRPILPGIPFLCDLDHLIERVFVSPFAPSWYVNTIEAVRDKFGFKFPVHRSTLMDKPPTPEEAMNSGDEFRESGGSCVIPKIATTYDSRVLHAPVLGDSPSFPRRRESNS